MRFTEFLVKNNVISQAELAKLVAKSQETGISLEKLLKAEGVSGDDIVRAKGEVAGLSFFAVPKKQIPFDVLKQIPEEAAKHYKFVPLEVKDGILSIGIVNPDDMEAREALQFIISRSNFVSQIFLISEKDFDMVIEEYKGLHGEVNKVLGDIESDLADTFQDVSSEEFLKNEANFVEEAPITKMATVILKHAVVGGASDIHIEPISDKLKVRFRVNGILHTSLILPANVHEALVARIKIVTNMKLDEKRKPQDGRFEARVDGRMIDFRVSTFPSFYGEKVVIRILDKEKGIKSLEELGFSVEQAADVKWALTRPYGLVLVTGPTGSGKSTTLYAMMKELDKEKFNIVSLEDPIEYNIDGINQSQVKPEIGYDFANGLKSILRQDPNIIMVGEIRDKETAALAIQAGLTGHLVLSTLHTNSTSGVIPRLVDMGVDPFLIAPTLLLMIGQRLVRTLCPDSKKEILLEGSLKKRFEKEVENIPTELRKDIKVPDKVYQGIPSTICPQGAKGRQGVFEILKKTPGLENIILTNPVEQEIIKEARKQGMLTMREDGLIKLFNGNIGIDDFNQL